MNLPIYILPIAALLTLDATGQPLLDSDGDGYPDLQELAQGLPAFGPNAPRGNPAFFTSGTYGGVIEYPAVTFRCLPGIIHGFGYQVQESSDCKFWTDINMRENRIDPPVSINDGSPVDLITIKSNQPIDAATRLFLRVAISPPWPPDSLRFSTVTIADVNAHFKQSTLGIIPANTLTKAVFDTYNPYSDSEWSRFGWTNKVYLSGVAFDDLRAGTLISPRHVLMATHFPRDIGDTMVFHDRSGQRVARTLIDRQSVPGGINPDITVGLLDADVALDFYRVLPPRNDWNTYLAETLVTATDQEPKLLVKKISYAGNGSNPYVFFANSTDVNAFYDEVLVGGDSGNPTFVLLRGEPVLIETHTFGGEGTGPFFLQLQTIILSIRSCPRWVAAISLPQPF